jgi:hypothetical protein
MRLAGLLVLAGILALPVAAQQPAPAEKTEKEKKADPAAREESPRPVPQLQRREPKPLDWADVDILTGKTRRAAEQERRRSAQPYVYLDTPVGGLGRMDAAGFSGRVSALPLGLTSRSFGLRGRNLLGLPLLTRTGRRGTVIIVR